MGVSDNALTGRRADVACGLARTDHFAELVALPAHAASSPSEPSREIARRLVAREVGSETDDAALLASIDRVCGRVADSLTRWFGPYGALALLTRALARAQSVQPSLAEISVNRSASPSLNGFADSAKAHGVQTTADGAIALLAVLTDLIGRLIGTDLALNLLEQSAPHSSTPGNDHQKVTDQ